MNEGETTTLETMRRYVYENSDTPEPHQHSNLFELKLDRVYVAESGYKNLLHRAVIVCKTKGKNNFEEIGRYYEKFFVTAANQLQTETAHGLLLVYPEYCVHVVEASMEMILELLRDITNTTPENEYRTNIAKLLSISRDIPYPLYQSWSYRSIDIVAQKIDEYEPSETEDKLVIDMLTQLLKLGKHLKQTKERTNSDGGSAKSNQMRMSVVSDQENI
ncbi:DgyrCDS11905 [Dimorphilus gyrociliatus]|uniref:DgyrCDS11905 n=1 Tax=Dimorphilus gyrociliatus TaxID=2664684 RepID=A0A7I8W7D3_9ANNE|nr:DgyrCDS11905 [Dimorphilus gyrociliatus]